MWSFKQSFKIISRIDSDKMHYALHIEVTKKMKNNKY